MATIMPPFEKALLAHYSTNDVLTQGRPFFGHAGTWCLPKPVRLELLQGNAGVSEISLAVIKVNLKRSMEEAGLIRSYSHSREGISALTALGGRGMVPQNSGFTPKIIQGDQQEGAPPVPTTL